MKHKFFIGLLLIGGLSLLNAQPAPEKLLKEAFIFGDAPYLVIEMQMTIETKRGKKRREMRISMKKTAEIAVLIEMISPRFLRNVKALYLRDKKEQEKTLVKSSRGIQEGESADTDTSLFGSDFLLEDLLTAKPGEMKYKLLNEDNQFYKIEAVPAGNSDYSKKIYYIRKSTTLLERFDVVDSKDRLLRQFKLTSTQTIDGKKVPQTLVMETPRNESRTELEITLFKKPQTLANDIFSIENFKKDEED